MLVQLFVIILLFILIVNVLYLFVFSVAGCFKGKCSQSSDSIGHQRRYLVLIPGYKEDAVIVGSVQHVMRQAYPSHLFHCAVLADAFLPETIETLKATDAEVFVLGENPDRNKATAIQLYLDHCPQGFDACIILDADNCVEEDFLARVDIYFNQGIQVLQARRVAKNENNRLARLDSLSEIINNHIFRKGQRVLGFSSSLIGSGMIIEMNLFRSLMEGMDVFSGFDKELELRMLKRRIKIDYAEDILIYDEKVSKQDVYVNQRRRWIYAQFYFLRQNAVEAIKELFIHGNTDYFNKVFQFALLPRIITIGYSLLMLPLTLLAGLPFLITHLLVMTLLISSLYLASYQSLNLKELSGLLAQLPSAFKGMLIAIFSSGKAAKQFIHTPHNI